MTAIYVPNFIKDQMGLDAQDLFNKFWSDLCWERRSDAPRREYWSNDFDRAYSYGTGAGLRTYTAQEMTPEIVEIRSALYDAGQGYYEGCFLNGYEGARDWLGWHEDDDPGIDHSKGIAIVTLYGNEGIDKPRSIQFREKLGIDDATGKMTYGPTVDLPLEQGSLCLMPAGFQATHQHRIPKAGFNSRSRISLTFRSLL